MTPPEDVRPEDPVDGPVEGPVERPVEPEVGPEWSRLAPAMTVVGPLRSLRGFLIPGLVAVVGIGGGDVGASLRILPFVLVAALLLGLVPWLTTRWRASDTHLQVRRGLLNRTTSTAPLDRVRSVDLESSLMHRALGLTTVKVGTGVDDTRIELDALTRDEAERLQAWLLERRTAQPPTQPPTQQPARAAPGPADADVPWARRPADAPAAPDAPDVTAPLAAPAAPLPPEQLARIDWSWLRFAPLSLSRLFVVAGFLGAISQVVDDVPVLDRGDVRAGGEALLELGVLLLVVVGLLLATVGWLAISVIGYVLQWWDFRLVRADASLRLTAGLFTTRSTTVEEARVRGVRLTEPVLMQPAGGAELHALATGVGSGGITKLLPPSPVAVDRAVGSRVLGTDEPLAAALRGHGAAARRRCLVRAVRTALVPAAAIVAGALFAEVVGWWLAPVLLVLLGLAVAAGMLSARNLGHALTAEHLVAGAPTAARTRTALELDGVIGWSVRQSLFQRRAGLVTLVATTAAGPEHVDVVDVPRPVALALAAEALPAVRGDLLAAGPRGETPTAPA